MRHTYYVVDGASVDVPAFINLFRSCPEQRKDLVALAKRTAGETFTARTHVEAYRRMCGMLSIESRRGILAVTATRLVYVSLYDGEDFVITA